MKTKQKKETKARPPAETVADFKSRIALMMRNQNNEGKVYTVAGGPRAHECVVRK
jgi:hypothetical protein